VENYVAVILPDPVTGREYPARLSAGSPRVTVTFVDPLQVMSVADTVLVPVTVPP
jgi:hypothetical protein